MVVAIDHPGDAEIVEFPDGHLVFPTSQMDIQKAFTVRVADARFVLDELAGLERSGVFKGRLDLGRIGMFGHSLGGAAAASTMLVDRRVRAGADLDGLLFGQVRTWAVPPLPAYEREPGFAADPNRAGFWKNLRGTHYAVDVKGAQHFAFSDIAFLVPVLSGRARRLEQPRNGWSGTSTGSRHWQPNAPTSARSSTAPYAGSHNRCSRRPQGRSSACA